MANPWLTQPNVTAHTPACPLNPLESEEIKDSSSVPRAEQVLAEPDCGSENKDLDQNSDPENYDSSAGECKSLVRNQQNLVRFSKIARTSPPSQDKGWQTSEASEQTDAKYRPECLTAQPNV